MAGEFDRSFLRYMKEYCVDQVIILGHINPDGDAAGSVMGLAHYIRYNYPEYRVIPYLANTMDKGPKRMVLEDTLFDPFQKPKINGKYAVIVCDSARVERIVGAEYLEGAHFTLLIDHHLWNARYCDVNYVMESEACAHNVYDLVDNEKITKAACESYPNVADYLYLGILHDTSTALH